jgi:hypothetical protein
MAKGVSEEELIAVAAGDLDAFTPQERAAIELAEDMTTRPTAIERSDRVTGLRDSVLEAAKVAFSDRELVELMVSISMWNALSRLHRALDLPLDMSPPPAEVARGHRDQLLLADSLGHRRSAAVAGRVQTVMKNGHANGRELLDPDVELARTVDLLEERQVGGEQAWRVQQRGPVVEYLAVRRSTRLQHRCVSTFRLVCGEKTHGCHPNLQRL